MGWVRTKRKGSIQFEHRLPRNRLAKILIGWKASRPNQMKIRLMLIKDEKILWKFNKTTHRKYLTDEVLNEFPKILEDKLEELGEYDD